MWDRRTLAEALGGVALLALAGLSLFLWHEIDAARSAPPAGDTPAPTLAAVDRAPTAGEAALESLRSENRWLRTALAERRRANAEREAAAAPGDVDWDTPEFPTTGAEARLNQLAAVEMESVVERRYGEFIASLGLTKREEKELRAELAQRGHQGVAGFGLEGAGRRPDDSDRAIGTLIGENELRRLEDYERSADERRIVQGFEDTLPEEQALNANQRQRLVDALYRERETLGMPDPYAALADPTTLTPEALSDFEVQADVLVEAQIEAAARILTPAQLDELEADLRQDARLKVLGLEMAREALKSVTPRPGATDG